MLTMLTYLPPFDQSNTNSPLASNENPLKSNIYILRFWLLLHRASSPYSHRPRKALKGCVEFQAKQFVTFGSLFTLWHG